MMGTGPFAVPTFEWLLTGGHDVPALVTRPTPPQRGRRRGPANPMRDVARQHELRIFEPADVNSDQGRQVVAEAQAELLVVCDYGQILSDETLSVARLGGVNLHASLLPKYRGAAPINWALYHGETETGVSVIHMTPRLDAGPCLIQHATSIGEQETAVELETRLAQIGAGAVNEAISLLSAWDGESPLGNIQNDAQATRARRLKKDDGAVNWSRSAADIRNQVRAMQPWPGTYTHWQRQSAEPLRVILSDVSVVNAVPPATPGTVIESGGDHLLIATGGGAISIDRIQPSGKRAMAVAEFLRGYPVTKGDLFG